MARGKFKSRCHDGAELRQARLPGIDDGPQEGEEEVVVGLLKPAKLPNDRPQLESHSWMFLRTFPAVVVETKAGVFRGELGELSFCDRDDQIRYFKPNQSGVTGQKQKIQPKQT